MFSFETNYYNTTFSRTKKCSSNTTFENTKLQTVFLSTERIVMANKKEYNKPCSHIHNVAGSSSQLGECFFFSFKREILTSEFRSL